MHQLSAMFFARPLARVPAEITRILETEGPSGLSDEQDEFFTTLCGVAPGRPEAFATQQARDAALGPYSYVDFVETSWAQVNAAGFAVDHVAIGHAFGTAGFEEVAKPVLDAVARRFRENDAGGAEVVVHRMRYLINRRSGGSVQASGAAPEFRIPVDAAEWSVTAAWIEGQLASRLRLAVVD